jgi:hypothetical protein
MAVRQLAEESAPVPPGPDAERPAWVITPALLRRAEVESARLFDVVREGTYPPEWPAVAWLVKAIVRGRCEHCGRRRRLAVHHLDRDKLNLQHWNLVALCWETCHLWVETHLCLDRDQLDLFGEYPTWMAWRLHERALWPLSDRQAPVPAFDPPAELAVVTTGAGRACACGCGRWVSNRSRDGRPRQYFSAACRQRIYKERRLQQLTLFTTSPG